MGIAWEISGVDGIETADMPYRLFRQPFTSKVREFADDVRDGKFVLPIGRRMPLRDEAEAHALGEKGGIGKILLLAPDSQH